jgi:hypothetical protein
MLLQMTKRPNIYIFIGTVFLILTWLFVGLYRDDEFYEPNLFTKYRPTLKVNFYSPTGMSDLTVDDLIDEKKVEEIAFQEFVIKQHIQYNSNARLWYLPFILIQLTLTFLNLGLLKIKHDLVYKKWLLPSHFISCLMFTSIALGFMLSFDQWIADSTRRIYNFSAELWCFVIFYKKVPKKTNPNY